MATRSTTKAPDKSTGRSLHDLLIQKLQVLYDVEHEILKALPKMTKRASHEDLKSGFDEHLKQTETHVQRLKKIFSTLGQKPTKNRSEGIRGIIEDGAWVMQNIRGPAALDANLIAAAQYVEHYEIAGYGSAHAWAVELGLDDIADILSQNLEEEKATDKKLDELATSGINARANPDAEDASAEQKSGETDATLPNLLSGQSSEDND